MRLIQVAVLCLTLCITVAAHAGLVGFWDFNGNVKDVSANGRDGTASTGVAYSANVPLPRSGNQSLSLNGSDAYVDIAAHPALNARVFTIAGWINQNGLTQGGTYQRWTSRGSDSFETAVSASGVLSVYPSAGTWRSTGYSLPSTGWRHIALTADGTNMQLFVNGTLTSTIPFTNTPSGMMRFGMRVNGGGELLRGLLDDMALWDEVLPASSIAALAAGARTPDELDTDVTSRPSRWWQSTVRRSGGAAGTWTLPWNIGDPVPPEWTLPEVSTFTNPAPAATGGGVYDAAGAMGVAGALLGDGGAGQPTGVQYLRTTFQLPGFTNITAHLQLAADNGAQVFINGTEVARETSYLVENWQSPFPALTITDGVVHSVTKFDQWVPLFTNWRFGENELIVALRNPDSEGLSAGALALRLDIITSLPEPGSLAGLGVGCLCLALYWCGKARRCEAV